MALNAGQRSRPRSSTLTSRGLSTDEQASPIVSLVRQFVDNLPLNDDSALIEANDRALELKANLASQASTKDVFRRARGLESVLSAFRDICVTRDDDSRPYASIATLLQSLLLLLAEAFQDHRGNSRYFVNRCRGWEALRECFQSHHDHLLRLHHEDDGTNYIKDFCDLLLAFAFGRGLGDSPDEDATVVHHQACATLLHLAFRPVAGRIDFPAWRDAVVIVAKTVKRSIRSQIALWETGVSSVILSRLLDNGISNEQRIQLMELATTLAYLGTYDLNDTALLLRRARDSENARTILLHLLNKSNVPPFIHFDLTQSGYCSLELPSLPRTFPPTTGYTLSAWIRFDTFDPNCHTTIFGAFDMSQTCFILVYLEKDSHQLILQTSIRSVRPSVRLKSTKFSAGRWYHIAIVHRRATADSKTSPAMLFVDGEFAEQVKCAYPETPPLPNDTGNSHASDQGSLLRSLPVQTFFGTPHDLAARLGQNTIFSQWSLANAHLFQAPLTDEFIAVLHRLGPRYSGNYQDCLGPLLTYRASAELNRYNELLHPDKSDRSDIIQATEHRGSDVIPESKLLLSFTPSAIVALDGRDASSLVARSGLDRKAWTRYQSLSQKAGSIVINAAVPSVREAIARSYGSAILTGNPVVALPKAVDDATWCLAGCMPPLFKILESAVTKKTFLQALEILFECVKDNWRISEAMEKGNGFGILILIIREKLGLDSGPSTSANGTRRPVAMLPAEDRQSLPLELLQMILTFVGYDQSAPEKSMIVNPMAYRVLLIDFDTWRRCDLETQKIYYAQFLHLVVRNHHQSFNHKRLSRMRVVKKLVDAMKTEDFQEETVQPLMAALRALLDHNSTHSPYKDLAMFVAFGLQDERALPIRPMRSVASMVKLRQRAASWARHARASRPTTPLAASSPAPQRLLSRFQLALQVLDFLTEVLCDDRNSSAIRRFVKTVPIRWMSHLLAETDSRVVTLTVRIVGHALVKLGSEFRTPFVDKNGGFTTLRSRMKALWRDPAIWYLCFGMMFGREISGPMLEKEFTVFSLLENLNVDNDLHVPHPDILPTTMNMLEAGLRDVVKDGEPSKTDVKTVTTIIQFLTELYGRSQVFRDFASSSRYSQELLFVLYPVIVGSDRLSADTEFRAEKDSLSFRGEEVTLRPHSNSLGERPPSVRSLTLDKGSRTPSPGSRKRVEAPKRLSSFVLVNAGSGRSTLPSARFNPVISPRKSAEPVNLNVGNSIIESLLEVSVNLSLDQICNKKDFNGLGLFQKVPPGFREHQAYFESYVLVHTLSQLWNHLQLNQGLLQETKVLTNLGRHCQHLAEAVFEGWFIDGAQPVIDFIGKVLDYLQQPNIAEIKTVRLCSQAINVMRIVFLRVTLLRLSELDESADEGEAVRFLNQMNYWQTILFSSDNQETLFIRLICFLLYMKLTSSVHAVRLAAASLWRTILMQKPTETATLLTYAMGSEQRHLSTGFMKLVQVDDEEFIAWVDDNRPALDAIFIDALAKPWADFVSDENRRNEETARSRLGKRREKLRLWQAEESSADDFLHRYENSTSHWRSNIHAQERLKSQRAMQDHQENVNHLLTVYARFDTLLRQPCGMDASADVTKWKLDETESVNRMRMRTLPDTTNPRDGFQPKRKFSERQANGRLAVNTQIPRISDDILSSVPGTPRIDTTNGNAELVDAADRPRSGSISNSQLLEGAFEMVEDPKEDEDGIVEDKNRKVLTSLQRGDMVQQLYNTSRIVGLEACEGLLVIGKKCLYLQDNFFQRSDGEIVSVSQAPEDERDPYLQLISGKDVGSQQTKHSTGDQTTRHWTWTEVLSVSKRRFLFRDVSLEVFFTDGRSYLLTCMSTKTRDELYSAIVTRAPHVHSATTVASEDAWRLDNLRNPEETPSSFGSRFANVFSGTATHAATKKWVRGEMSNFQYLMLVNTMAGRSFNDLTQYPVFPWVLADYTSEELDLTNPKTFRDFAKPMGCQTPARAAEFRDRYQQFAEMSDQNAPAFNYGTHYSSAMIVSSYLIRLQPFVQSYLLLQGGNFDYADRLFDSIEKAWLSASRDNMSDVRELTPEFYYLPEFLVNVNKYDFGVKQGDGEVVDDVKLPPWAKGDPHVFIAKHREALESPYVSEQLHHWIDLVFGFKQRGEAAVEATNVFQHLSYGGAKDLDTIDDAVERLATIGIIHSFGQTPYQVFQRPHASREPEKFTVSRLDTQAPSLVRLPTPLFESDEKVAGLAFSPTQERLLCSSACKLNMLPTCDRFLQWGFADHSVRFFSSNSKRLLGVYENTHIGPVTTAVLADSKTLITGGEDCTLGIWTVIPSRDLIEIQSKTYLFGHRAAISILAASRVFSTLLSASADGHVLLWDLNRHDCVRVLVSPGGGAIQAARINNISGHIVLCRGPDILLFTLNGHLLLQQKICESQDEQMNCCAFYEGAGNEWVERELLFTGHGHGVINIWALTSLSDGTWHLQLVNRLNHTDASREDGGNTSAAITAVLPMAGSVYTGDDQGRVWGWDVLARQVSATGRMR